MDEEIKTSTGSIVPEHQKEWRHGRGFDHVAQTQKGGKRSTAPGLHEKTASAQVRGGTVQACGRARATLFSHTDFALSQAPPLIFDERLKVALLWALSCRIKLWHQCPLKAEQDSPKLCYFLG